ncbi:MAG TPA: oligosaccharide flippase family protein [Solirubrobacteraceae bacterium]|nr:oligosaccharide flippase family protein [Solirubrobacteraceae bacterium]
MIGGAGDHLDAAEAGQRALRGGVLRSAGYAGGILLSLASVPILVHHLGTVGFGEYVTALSIVALVLGLTEGGLNAIALREYATLRGTPRDQLMRNALGVRLVLSSVGVAGAIGFTALAGYGSTMVLGVTAAGAGLIIQLMQSILSVPLQSELSLGRASLVDFARQVVSVALIIVLALTGAGLVALLAVAIPASVVSLLLTAVLVRRLTPLRPAFHPRDWWPLLRDSVPYAAAIAVNVVYFRIAIILTSLLSTKVQTGYFAVSFRIIEVLVGVPALAIGAVFPILARAEGNDDRRFLAATGRLFELSLLAGVWIVVMLEVGAPFAIGVLTGSDTDPSVTVLRIQAIAIVATFANVAGAYPMLSLRRYRELLIANLVALGVCGVLVVALVGPLGARGAAIAASAGEVGLAVAVAVLLVRVRPDLRLPFPALGVAALAGAAAVAVGLLLPVPAVAQTLVAALVYLAALRLMGRLPPEIGELVRSRRPVAG